MTGYNLELRSRDAELNRKMRTLLNHPGRACRTADPNMMAADPEQRNLVVEAKKVCAGCPVKALCLEVALQRREPSGVWGALDADERRSLLDRQQRRQRRLEAV